jgi:hypothetical protein
MGFPILAVAGIAVSIGSKILGGQAKNKQAKAQAAAQKENALVQLAETYSGLSAREREELASSRQQKRLGRRESARLEARAIAAGADAGTGSDEQVRDVQVGEAEFVSSVEAQLARVNQDLDRRRRGARKSFDSQIKAADAGLPGSGQDFLDFANTAAFAINAFSSLDQPTG